MPASDTQIANLALSGIGTRSSIASLNENSAEARTCRLHYELARDDLLRAAHWNFARRQVALALLRDATKSPPDPVPQPWLYEYAYPQDCVLMRYLMPLFLSTPGVVPGTVSTPNFTGPPVRFILSSDQDANGNDIKVILTSQNQSIGVYTKRITDASLFDSTFVLAFSALLASRIAIALTGDKKLAVTQFQIAQGHVAKAQAMDGNEGIKVQDVQPDWIKVRGYASDWGYPDGGMFWTTPQQLTMIT